MSGRTFRRETEYDRERRRTNVSSESRSVAKRLPTDTNKYGPNFWQPFSRKSCYYSDTDTRKENTTEAHSPEASSTESTPRGTPALASISLEIKNTQENLETNGKPNNAKSHGLRINCAKGPDVQNDDMEARALNIESRPASRESPYTREPESYHQERPYLVPNNAPAEPIRPTPRSEFTRARHPNPARPRIALTAWRLHDPIITLLGKDLSGIELAPFLTKWATACYGEDSDQSQYWERKIAPEIVNADIHMAHAYTQLHNISPSHPLAYPWSVDLMRGNLRWKELKTLLEHCENKALGETDLPWQEEPGAVLKPAAEKFLFAFAMHPTNGVLMRSIRDWNRYYADKAKSTRGVQGTWKCDGTPMLTILGHTLHANGLAPFFKKWVEKCFGQENPDHLSYWERIVIPPIMTCDRLMTVNYTRTLLTSLVPSSASSSASASSPSSSPEINQQEDESKLNISLFNGDQIWAECKVLLEESAQEAYKENFRLYEVGVNSVNAGEGEGHAVENSKMMGIFLDAFLLHPGFGRLMRGFNTWNIMNGAGAGKVRF